MRLFHTLGTQPVVNAITAASGNVAGEKQASRTLLHVSGMQLQLFCGFH